MTPAAAARAAALERLAAERFDLLVVGGGITGAGVLLDATSRGLRAALVERDDIASGTSSRSSKLIHGGLRYLEQYRFRLVHQALAERRRLLRLAPHLVRLEPFLVPVYGSPLWLGWYAAGLTLYDLLGAARDGGRTRFLRPGSVRRLAPGLTAARLAGGFVYHDGVTDDARLATAVLRTALARGGVAATRVGALEPIRSGDRIEGAVVRDELSGQTFEVRAAAVVDATGATGGFLGHRPDGAAVTPSRGTHVIVPRERIRAEHGMTIRVPGRVVFVIPWGTNWIVGTTDVPHDGPLDRPVATADEVAYLLDVLAGVLEEPVTERDIVATYAGIRPLAGEGDGNGSTITASREHRIERLPEGVVQVRGGKYTTYRVMAAEAVDVATRESGAPRSATDGLRIAGAIDGQERAALERSLAARFGSVADSVGHLLGRYGSEAADVLRIGEELDLLRPLPAGEPYLEAEVAWAAREELALTVDDVLARRTRLAIESPDQAAAAAPRVAEILGAELGWSQAEIASAAARYSAHAPVEYGLPRSPRTATRPQPLELSEVTR